MTERLDRIRLSGLRVRGYHGVLPEERRDGQEFVVDVCLGLDLGEAARGDDLASTVHYGELADRLVAAVQQDPVDLIESLAERLAALCLAEPRVREAEVTVHKPQAPIPHPFGDVSVTVVRDGRTNG